jgi:thiol-disulfide isomerase/thioredoxin
MKLKQLCEMVFVLSVIVLANRARAQQIESGRWSGVATVHGQQVPVQLDLSAKSEDGKINGDWVNGKEIVSSSGGQLTGSHLVLNFDYFARKLEGDFTSDGFKGTFGGARGAPSPIELHPEAKGGPATTASANPAPIDLSGDWEVAVKSPKGESAWILRIVSAGNRGEIKAVILRIDGDTGGLYGSFDQASGAYRVSHFNASGPALYSLKPNGDGTLQVTNLLRDDQRWTARRPSVARQENLAPPTKDTEQTSVVDPSKPLEFSAPTLAGATVTSADSRFKGKVVVVAIGGSWCPNCHDEAPFLVELYNRYHARGLEIVDVSFEEDDQLKNPERLRAFIARYKIPYTVLLGGTPSQLNEKIPQGKNLNCWPTTFFVGRDGLVKEVHAGFSGPATGAAYTDLKAETFSLIGRLLAETEAEVR